RDPGVGRAAGPRPGAAVDRALGDRAPEHGAAPGRTAGRWPGDRGRRDGRDWPRAGVRRGGGRVRPGRGRRAACGRDLERAVGPRRGAPASALHQAPYGAPTGVEEKMARTLGVWMCALLCSALVGCTATVTTGTTPEPSGGSVAQAGTTD